MDIYEQYALLKAQRESIDEKIEKVNAEIVADMKSRKVLKEESTWGKFTLASKKNYKYSKKVVDLEDKVKILKHEEVEKGIAKVVETNYLLFKINE